MFILFVYTSCVFFLLFGCETVSNTEPRNGQGLEVKYKGDTIKINDEYNEWELDTKFEYQTASHSGERVTYEVVGKKDGFGITGPFPIVSNDGTNKGQKYFWWYWGGENIKNQPVKVMGYKKGANELISLHTGEFFEGAQINEKEVNMPSGLRFPSSGVWNLLVYINDDLYGNVVVEVVPK
jgi:hypothetical protein